MFKPKLPLRVFAAAIAQSVCKANEMLERDHLQAVRQFGEPNSGIVPPPAPLVIRKVKVMFSGNVSRAELDKAQSELCIDLSKPDGNFSAELEFCPLSGELLRELRAAPAEKGDEEPEEGAYLMAESPGGLPPTQAPKQYFDGEAPRQRACRDR